MQVFEGTLVHSLGKDNPLEILPDYLLGVRNGKIIFVEPNVNRNDLKQKYEFFEDCIEKLEPHEFLMPGFVDTHIHASQYQNLGIGLDQPLLEWLDKYTFPEETKYKDLQYANTVYSKAIDHCLSVGTTTAQYFATIHLDSSLLLCRLAHSKGQRALVGKVSANQHCPHYYTESRPDAIRDAKEFVTSVLQEKYSTVLPVVTPRFAVSCDMELMEALGSIAKEYDVYIQSHLSESKAEIQLVKELYPEYSSYTEVYDKAGLLTNKTTMAHGIYLDNDELKLLQRQNASISHCPNSNLTLRSGVCDVRRLHDNNIKVGIGSDVSGGYEISLLDAMKCAVHTSMFLQISGSSNIIDCIDAFHLATLGGAEALGLSHCIGNLTVGKEFDALIISMNTHASTRSLFKTETWKELFQKFILLGDDRNIKKVFVAGKLVHHKNA